MRGRFITFEGGEGAGKSTQIRLLAERLRASNKDVVVTREPGGTPAAEAIRTLLLSGGAAELGPEAEAVLFAAARTDHVAHVIRPALLAGRWVLCDRFFDSTRVYQGGGAGVRNGMLDALERVAVGKTRPDLTIILDVPAAVGLARAAQRMATAGTVPDRFERDDLAIHEARRQAFLAIAAAEPERCIVIDATRSDTETSNAVWQATADRLFARRA
jgi:dTMP kinase